MNYRLKSTAVVAMLVLTACGGSDGGSAGSGSDSDGPAGAEVEFPVATMTGEETCAALPLEEMQALIDFAEYFNPAAIDTPPRCILTVTNGDASQTLNGFVSIANEGGQAGYDFYLQQFGASPETVSVSGIGEAASLLPASNPPLIVVLKGDRVIEVGAFSKDGVEPALHEQLAKLAVSGL